MASLNRIVLLDFEGDEIFSGASLLSKPPPAPDSAMPETVPYREAVVEQVEDEEDEAAPETLRSSVFMRAHEPTSRPIIVLDESESPNRAA